MPYTYIRFLNFIDTLDGKNPGRHLDYLETQLLDLIMKGVMKRESFLVGDLIDIEQLGSPATLHGRVKNLAAKGYIELVVDKEDCRKKSVVPTKLASEYVRFMSNCLNKSLSAQ